MAKTKEEKKKIIEELEEYLEKQKAIVFVGFKGLKVKESFDLRNRLKSSDCLLKVVKKTLMKIAFKNKKMELPENLEGEVALVFGFRDEISPFKIAHKFSLENENFKILGGYFDGAFVSKEKVEELAKIPSREELLANVVANIASPLRGFVYVLQSNLKGLITVLARAKTQ